MDTSRPVWHPQWEPLWAAAAEHDIPLSFHVRTKGTTTTVAFEPEVNLVSTAAYNAVVQMQLDEALASVLMCGALERHPSLRVVLAESGVGWIPYVLERADYQLEDHIDEYGRALKTPPSELFRRQMHATFQKDSVGTGSGRSVVPRQLHVGLRLPPRGRRLAGLPRGHRPLPGGRERGDASQAWSGITAPGSTESRIDERMFFP